MKTQTGACAPSASAVRETPGAARSPGSTLRLFLPVIYTENRPLASRAKGVLAKRPNCKTLVERRPRAAQAFDARAALFRFEPALAGSGGRLGRPAWNRRHGGAADQFDETLARVLAVAFLGAMALGV